MKNAQHKLCVSDQTDVDGHGWRIVRKTSCVGVRNPTSRVENIVQDKLRVSGTGWRRTIIRAEDEGHDPTQPKHADEVKRGR